jgi:sulfatase modifying factor 1
MTTDDAAKPCCGPSAKRAPLTSGAVIRGAQNSYGAVQIPSGNAFVGTRHAGVPDDGETPLRRVKLKSFLMGETTVTNAQFEAFVKATGYKTEAERFGWSFVFWSEIPQHVGPTAAVVDVEWWRQVEDANWLDINGPNTQADAWFGDHPVVQISWNDARAYAAWVGGRLPTEAEWEHAARGGLGDVAFPWGEETPNDTTFMPCNIWQGHFPETNTGKDGYKTTAPAKSFEPNGYGLFNVVGNVWEWTTDPYRVKSLKKNVRTRVAQMKGYKLSKGGSFLCHRSYCYRYRIAARSGTSPDSATTHHGFRVVWPAA